MRWVVEEEKEDEDEDEEDEEEEARVMMLKIGTPHQGTQHLKRTERIFLSSGSPFQRWNRTGATSTISLDFMTVGLLKIKF